MDQSAEVLFKLIRIALGNEKDFSLPNNINWYEVFDMSIKQGVVNIAYDGLQSVLNAHPDQSWFDVPEMELLRYKWIGYGMYAEKSYEKYVKSISSLVSFFSTYGFQIILLKGYGLSLYYPKPSHRPIGDIDIVTIKHSCEYEQVQADNLVHRILNIPVTKSKIGHHSHYNYQNILVENHYEFSNTYHGSLKQKQFEETLQWYCRKDLRSISLGDEVLFLPSPTFNAIFLMWHMASHFTNSHIVLRQLCDWCQFLKAEKDNIDWQIVNATYNLIGLDMFARAIGRVISDCLGVSLLEGTCSMDKKIESRIIDDIFSYSEYKGMIRRFFRYPQYGWKYRLAYQSYWLPKLTNSILLHLFHKEDIEEVELSYSKN